MASSILNYYLTIIISVLVFVRYGLAQNIYSNIHSEMSLDELRNIFHIDSHHEVPDYEVINIHHIPQESRDPFEEVLQNSQSSHQSVTVVKPDPKILLTVNASSVDITSDSNNSELSKSKYPKKTYANYEQLFTNKKKQDFVKIVESNKFINGDGQQSESVFVPLDDGVKIVEENIQLEAFGKKLNLTLKPTDGLIKKGGLKLFMVEPNVTSQHGVDYVEVHNDEEEHVGEVYQDEQNQAAVLLRPDPETGKYLMEGNIGKDLVIKPLPKHLRKAKLLQPDLSDDELFLNQDDLNSEVSIDTGLPIRRNNKRSKRAVQLHEHVVYKRKLNDEEYYGDYAFMEPDHMGKRYRRTSDFESIDDNDSSKTKSRRKREAPYVIYPEILVIVDYDGYRLHGGDNLQIKRYFVSFWNGVDLRYKLLKGPRVRISIAGIIISRGRDATPYLERNRVGRDAIDSAAALTDMGKYLFKERRLPVYDIAVAITKLDMCRRQFANDVCNRGTAGFAYVGGACVVNKRLEKVNSVAIIEDTGGFSGIIVAAHEVGHLLGAVHDGSPPPSYLGGPGAEKCRWEDGYIMSDLRHTERGFRWSPCSIQSFHHFLNGDTATCLYNSPHEDESLGRVLPGKLLTLDAQCRRDRGTSACFKDDRVCAQLFCFDSGSGYCVAYRPAAEGSPCGDGQYCINGRCVVENENIIPDYSQSSQYLRRSDDDFDYQNTASTEIRQSYTTKRYYPTTTTTTTTTEATTTPDYYQYYQYYQQQLSQQQQQETTENPYYNYYNTESTTTTQSPYKYHQYYTTKPQYFNYYSSGSSSPATVIDVHIPTTQKTPKPKTGGISSTTVPPTKSTPRTTTTTVRTTSIRSTKNPYVGDYYERLSRTTKSPYDWANIGRFTTTTSPKEFSGGNNYLKRSSNYYSASENHEVAATAGQNSTIRQS